MYFFKNEGGESNYSINSDYDTRRITISYVLLIKDKSFISLNNSFLQEIVLIKFDNFHIRW